MGKTHVTFLQFIHSFSTDQDYLEKLQNAKDDELYQKLFTKTIENGSAGVLKVLLKKKRK